MGSSAFGCIGATHPEGHDLLGKSEQAVMLLLSIFIRLATMIIGFLLAITIVNIAFRLTDYGFVSMLSDMCKLQGFQFSEGGDGDLSLVGWHGSLLGGVCVCRRCGGGRELFSHLPAA